MIKSMTGFGKAEAMADGKKIIAEVRSLNSKQLDLAVKAPPVYRSFETEIRGAASKILQRGKVDIYISVEYESGTAAAAIDKKMFSEYYRQLVGIAKENDPAFCEDNAVVELAPSILRLPEVVKNDGNNISEQEQQALMRAVNGALAALDGFRLREGETLIADILKRVERINAAIEKVVPFEKERTEVIKARIRENIEKMELTVDVNRLEQEMIYYIEKLDITEEKVRLANHCKYFSEVAASEENTGRKLGFIGQEMGREINTLGSKANNADIQRIVVGMKDELEKIKEQLLNIL